MDSNFVGTNMEQWQEVNGSPFDEAEELPFPTASFEEMEQAFAEGTPAAEIVTDEFSSGEEVPMSETVYMGEAMGYTEPGEAACVQPAEADAVYGAEITEPVEVDGIGNVDSVDTEATDRQECDDFGEANETVEAESGEAGAEAEESEGEEAEEIPETEGETDDTVDEELEEKRKRAEHEASEAKRKAEWEARQQAKKDAEIQELYRLESMPDEEVMTASMQRISTDTERLTRRNMKDCVSEYVQTLCLDDAVFARLAMHPKKNMVNCFRYINRKAREFVEQEMKDNDIKPENGVYGSDVPDDLCYQWAEEYFREPDAREDKPEKEETFEPIPYRGKPITKTNKKKPDKKATGKTAVEKKDSAKKTAEEKKPDNQEAAEAEKDSVTGQMSLMDYLMPDAKVS